MNEFLGHAFKNYLIKNEFGIKANCATKANPQANYILEMINQVIANLVHKFNSKHNYLYEGNPWSGILAATGFTVLSTHHTTLQDTPGQTSVRSRHDIKYLFHCRPGSYCITRRKQ